MKIERISLEHAFENMKKIDLKQLKHQALKKLEEISEREIIRKNKNVILIVAAVLVILLGAIFMHGGKPGRTHGAAEMNLNQTLSDNKAEIQNNGSGEDKITGVDWSSIFGNPDIPKILSSLSSGNVQGVYKNREIKVPAEFDSIQKAIDAARSGDVILVSAGQYKENIVMKDGVSVVGEKAETTILDGDKQGNVVTFKDVSDTDTRLENFTIKNSGENLSGVLIDNSSPLINRNVILQNDYDIYIKGESSPLVQRNSLNESKAGVQIFNLDVPRNSNPVISDNLIFGNKKGANVYKGNAAIRHNTLSFNSVTDDSGATFGIYLASASADIENNIITDNGICELCSGIYADEDSHDVKIDYNDLWNNQSNFVCFGKCEMGGSNLSDDPNFENGIQYDFSLKADSLFLVSASDGQKLGARL